MSEPTPEQKWEARYAAAGGYIFGTAPNAFLAANAGLIAPGAKVLSVADGEGRNSVFLAGNGADVHAVEVSPTALSRARKLAAERGVAIAFEQADLLRWSWPEHAYDAVVAIFVQFVPPAERSAFFGRLVRALRPGGLLLLEGYRPEQVANRTGGPSDPAHCYTEAMLREAFAGLEIERLDSYDAVLDEGPGHSGPSALIDLVARVKVRPGT